MTAENYEEKNDQRTAELKKTQERFSQGILEELNQAIETKSKIFLVISCPPNRVLDKATVLPEKIEDGHLHVITKEGSKISIALSRIRNARIVEEE